MATGRLRYSPSPRSCPDPREVPGRAAHDRAKSIHIDLSSSVPFASRSVIGEIRSRLAPGGAPCGPSSFWRSPLFAWCRCWRLRAGGSSIRDQSTARSSGTHPSATTPDAAADRGRRPLLVRRSRHRTSRPSPSGCRSRTPREPGSTRPEDLHRQAAPTPSPSTTGVRTKEIATNCVTAAPHPGHRPSVAAASRRTTPGRPRPSTPATPASSPAKGHDPRRPRTCVDLGVMHVS